MSAKLPKAAAALPVPETRCWCGCRVAGDGYCAYNSAHTCDCRDPQCMWRDRCERAPAPPETTP